MIGEVVGAPQMSTAMSIDVGANNASRMIGPTIGGLLLAGVGIAGVFTLSVALYAIAVVAALRRAISQQLSTDVGGIRAGAHRRGPPLVRNDRRLIGTLTVTVIYNVFGWPFTSMVPVIGQDQLDRWARRYRRPRQHGRHRRVRRRRADGDVLSAQHCYPPAPMSAG